ncbi:hypothetical protein C8J57DRAFT_1505481 [Mycena rebaudengoi]|nr:hypothetical protein C8J57DRAFT_1505481 [Mycena rebaudengoi]
MSFAVVLPAILVLVVFTRSAISRCRRPIARVPGPHATSWVYGNMLHLYLPATWGEFEFPWQRQYGPLYRIKGCFGEDYLVVSDPRSLQHILSGGLFTRSPVGLAVASAVRARECGSLIGGFVRHDARQANTLAFALCELAKDPDFQARLRAEINSSPAIESGNYDNLPLLNVFIKETLRMYPAESITEVMALEDTSFPLTYGLTSTSGEKIAELPIRKGQVICLAIGSYNRLESIWGPDGHEPSLTRRDTLHCRRSPHRTIFKSAEFLQRTSHLSRMAFCIAGDAGDYFWARTTTTVFEAEVVRETLAISSIPSLPHLKRIFLGIDSQSAIRALSHPRQQPGQYLLLEFLHELESLQRRIPGAQLHIGWVPGHVDFEPNERVDKEAKHVAQHVVPPHPRLPLLFHSCLPRSAAAAKAELRTHTTAQWTELWVSSPCYEKFKKLDKSATIHSLHKPLLNLSRRNSSLIMQLRTRMVGLNSWLHKIRRTDSPLCPTCHRCEDVPHFIFFCTRFSHHRFLLRNALGRKATSLGYLLTDETGIRHLLRYVHATNRLPAYHDTPPEESDT